MQNTMLQQTQKHHVFESQLFPVFMFFVLSRGLSAGNQDEMHVVGYFVESPIALLRKIVNIAGSFEHSGREWHTQPPWKSEEASWPEEKFPPRFSLAMLAPLVSLM